MRIALITTGGMELLGLPTALDRLFPGHTIEAVEDVPGRCFSCITSNRLPLPPTPYPPMVDKIVARAAAMVDPRLSGGPDMVLILDDLELANLDQPEVVVAVFRDAVARHLSRYEPDHGLIASMRAEITKRVSFHLAVPMVESWLFADRNGPSRAGVSPSTRVQIREGDVEDFQTVDPIYAAADDTACPEWCKRKRQSRDRPKWLGAGDRTRHPKGYLQWLMRDGTIPTCTSYSEVPNGVDALKNLDWSEVLKYKARCAYVRALVGDISALLNQPPAIPNWQGMEAVLTSRTTPRPDPVLRNI